MAEDEKKFPRKSESEKSRINFYNIYLFHYLIRYFIFPRKNIYFKEQLSLTNLGLLPKEIPVDQPWPPTTTLGPETPQELSMNVLRMQAREYRG